ncbi:1-deoxy-D-xylulose-5-phosphate reductoisomerase [Sphingomonas sp. ABOLG]|jgi:1-deoxy-D-xylulose-5-phosphate reductoisomerase|uniref:1-deoxy-D-xylulose-5-phosphate reductoisomerase n=1 Tax=Sphingomonas sp. ABOLG TaxID=1985880 RepID=UPI000F7F298B|nr:1-deoxy-D-xylulose-5-phosphate reductoisomerase [Sphingomonas sp. ABOLG]RSV18785.1 1-deoxy-D-xylulose-5-phosphate reductoisomerase [Sphingomonas sp. ABOLG]
MRTVTILGATGSIGTSTLDLLERSPEMFEVVALTANCDVERLAAAAIRTNAKRAVVADERCLTALRDALSGTGVEAAGGAAAVEEAASMDADITVAAIVGCAGLKPVMAAVEQGRTLALANKEALVSAGDVMNRAVRQSGATLLPVDSEHSAIFQCLDARMAERVSRIILTASGGPFRDRSLAAMQDISPAQAVAHPNWSMGAKISVDSATMMNKGLELIEAFHLFPVTSEQIEIVVHRQSVIHSMVEYVDGSVLAQLGTPDMRTPIACALAWPDRMPTPGERLDLIKVGRLDFEAPDEERFPALRLARAALNEGGGSPAILNAANEIAVAAFLGGRISYLEIAAIVSDTLDRFSPAAPDTLEAVLEVDREARVIAEKRVKGRAA